MNAIAFLFFGVGVVLVLAGAGWPALLFLGMAVVISE